MSEESTSKELKNVKEIVEHLMPSAKEFLRLNESNSPKNSDESLSELQWAQASVPHKKIMTDSKEFSYTIKSMVENNTLGVNDIGALLDCDKFNKKSHTYENAFGAGLIEKIEIVADDLTAAKTGLEQKLSDDVMLNKIEQTIKKPSLLDTLKSDFGKITGGIRKIAGKTASKDQTHDK